MSGQTVRDAAIDEAAVDEAAVGAFAERVMADGTASITFAYGPDLASAIERLSAPGFVNALVPVWLPAMPDVEAALAGGADVADVDGGSGRGGRPDPVRRVHCGRWAVRRGVHLRRGARRGPARVAPGDPRGAADQAAARGEQLGPLHGLPVSIKDSIETASLRTTCGAPELAGYLPARDATAVARLRAAGAIVFAKTNTPTWASAAQTVNPVFGTTNNPWDTGRSPGGSSGGPAAAVAAGLTGFDLGSDLGGSIRTPAGYCGVYGLRPSYGVVPLRGHLPPPPGALGDIDMAVLGARYMYATCSARPRPTGRRRPGAGPAGSSRVPGPAHRAGRGDRRGG